MNTRNSKLTLKIIGYLKRTESYLTFFLSLSLGQSGALRILQTTKAKSLKEQIFSIEVRFLELGLQNSLWPVASGTSITNLTTKS